MKISCLELFPQSALTQIPNHISPLKALKLLKFFTKLTFDAIHSFFIEKDFRKFDPHVGETSCQIRAYQFILISRENNSPFQHANIEQKLNLLSEILKKIGASILLAQLSQKNRTPPPNTTLANFISENYNFELNEEELFITQSYLLTKYKIRDKSEKEKINYHALCLEIETSKDTGRRLIHIYQKNISKLSCQFILHISAPEEKKLLGSLAMKDEEERSVLPCFFVMRTIIAHMRHTKPIIAINIKKNGIEYPVFVSDNNIFPISNREHSISKEKISYTVELQEKHPAEHAGNPVVKKTSFIEFENFILAHMALHPQYSGKKLKKINLSIFLDKNIKQMELKKFIDIFYKFKKNAKKNIGKSELNNYKITHIYFNKIASSIETPYFLKELRQKGLTTTSTSLI